jgi:hypothetical protein
VFTHISSSSKILPNDIHIRSLCITGPVRPTAKAVRIPTVLLAIWISMGSTAITLGLAFLPGFLGFDSIHHPIQSYSVSLVPYPGVGDDQMIEVGVAEKPLFASFL